MGSERSMGTQTANRSLTSRRQFIASAGAFPFALRALASPIPSNPRWVLLGTGTDKGIFRAAWNAERGELSGIGVAAVTSHPSFLAKHPELPILYAVNETPSGDGALCSFRMDPKSAALTPLERVSSEGNGPCYVSVDATGYNAFVANYGGGSLAAFGLGTGGALRSAGLFDCHNNTACGIVGPNTARQEAAHMHCAVISPDNRFVLACNLGEDAIEIFRIHPGATRPMEAPVRFAARAGSGPRHLAFHPNGLWLYCIHELDCTIDLYDWNVNNGVPVPVLRKDSVISTLASRAALPGSTGCEIVVSPDGRFVYGNTRGENSLVVYRVNASTGLLTEQQRVFSGGGLTRHIAFDPSRRWLLCANQGTSTVTVFAHDPATGRLAETPKSFAIDTPMFVQFV
jgi:6-phosphogluconolactonase